MDKISRKPKDYNPMTNDCLLPSNLERTRADFVRGITFLIRFVGRLEIDRPTNKDEIISAMRRVRQEYKLRSFKKRSASLTISIDGISVALMKKKFVPRSADTVEISWHHPINKVFYVSHDSRDLKVFSYIARDVPTNQFVCIVFKTSKEVATNIVGTIGKAFEVVHLMNNTKSDPTSPEMARATSPDFNADGHRNSMGRGGGNSVITTDHEGNQQQRSSGQGLMTRSYSSTGISTDLLHPLELPERSRDPLDTNNDNEENRVDDPGHDGLTDDEDVCPHHHHHDDECRTMPQQQCSLDAFEKRPIYEDDKYLIVEEEEDVQDESIQRQESMQDISQEDLVDGDHVRISERDLTFLKNQLIQLTKTLNLERRSNHFNQLRLEKLSYEFYLMKDQFSNVLKKLTKEGIVDEMPSVEQDSIDSQRTCPMCKNFLAYCIKTQCPHSTSTLHNHRSLTCYDFKEKLLENIGNPLDSHRHKHQLASLQQRRLPRAETCLINEFGEYQVKMKGNASGQPHRIHPGKGGGGGGKLFKNASFDLVNQHHGNCGNGKMTKLRNASCYKFMTSTTHKKSEEENVNDDEDTGKSENLIEFSPCKRSNTMFELSSNNEFAIKPKHGIHQHQMSTSKSHEFTTIKPSLDGQRVNPLFELLNGRERLHTTLDDNNPHRAKEEAEEIMRKVKTSKSDHILCVSSSNIKPLPPPLNDTETNRKRIQKAQTLNETSSSPSSILPLDFLQTIKNNNNELIQ